MRNDERCPRVVSDYVLISASKWSLLARCRVEPLGEGRVDGIR